MKNRKKLYAIISVAFNGNRSIREDAEKYGPEFWKDVQEYAETYGSGHSMRYTIMRDTVNAFFSGEKTKTVRLSRYEVYGTARVALWGGGKGELDMDNMRLEPDQLTADNVMRCVNDGRYGVEAILSAEIVVREVYTDWAKGKAIYVTADSDRARKLFNEYEKVTTRARSEG